MDSVTESFTTIYSKDLKLNWKQTRHNLQLKADFAINSLTVIYSERMKLY